MHHKAVARPAVRALCRSGQSRSGFASSMLLFLSAFLAITLGIAAVWFTRPESVVNSEAAQQVENNTQDELVEASPTPRPILDVSQTSTPQETVQITQVSGVTDSRLPAANEHAFLVGGASGEWLNASGLTYDGESIGFHEDDPDAALHLNLQKSNFVGMIIRGTALQSSNLTEWQNSDGNSVAWITPDGGARFNIQGKATDFVVSAYGKSSALFVEGDNGYVGIGTATPSAALYLVGNEEISGKLTIRNTADNEHLIELFPTGSTGHLSSNGGAFYIDNTNNTGAGYLVYSNAGAEALGNLLNVKVDNANFAQAGFYINYDGSSNGVEIVSNSTDSSSNALSVTGNNPNDSTLGVIGYETGKGTIKVSHNGSSATTNASGISIDLKGTGTAAQGLYVDSTATTGTTGNLLRLRNQSIDRFVVDRYGALSIGQNGTNTSITKTGNTAGDEFFVGTTGAFRVQRSAASSEAFRVQVNGDTQGRWLGTSDGQLKWGSGTASQDVVLRRSAASTLLLDGAQFSVKSVATSSDVMVWTASDGSRLGRVNETSGGHSWFELDNNVGTALFLVRTDGGDSYFNSGEFGIGTSTPAFKLDVQGNAAASYVSSFTNAGNDAARYGLQVQAGANDGSGTTYYMTALDGDGTVVGYLQNSSGTFSVNDPSDIRTKTNINDTIIDGLSVINALRVVDFDRISQPGGKRHHGFIAQEVQSVFPYMVSQNPEGLLTISKESLIPVLVKAMQQQQLQIENLGPLADLQTDLPTLEEQLISLRDEVAQLRLKQDLSLLKSELSPLARFTLTGWTWISEVVFEKPVTFLSDLHIKGNVINEQKDLAGFAVIHAGDTEVRVRFSAPLLAEPVIQLTAEGDGVQPFLQDVGLEGFVIRLSEPALTERKIHWFALPTAGAATFESTSSGSQSPSPSPALSPSPDASASAQP